MLVEKDLKNITIKRQAQLLEISRSSIYYQPAINHNDLDIMNVIDQIFTKYPFYGSRKIQWELRQNHNLHICRQHVQRLMRLMGIRAIFCRPNTSKSQPNHPKYPYLLSDLEITEPNQVWGTDITYIKLEHGFCYLTAIIDWYSRYVISWKLSANLEIDFCLQNLNAALHTATPDIFNSDQGSHFTSPKHTGILAEKEIHISMDGRGRCMDNIFTERLWRSVKYENVYLKSYANFSEANAGLAEYFHFYNYLRPHQNLQNQTPVQIYFKDRILDFKTTQVSTREKQIR